MGLFKIWKDHVTQFSNRYREVQNKDGTITHEAVEGEVIQEGTPQNAQNFNDLEQRVFASGEVAGMALLKVKMAESRIKELQEEAKETKHDMQEKSLANREAVALALLKIKIAESHIKGLQGEIIKTTLTNTKEYPFNNSKKTVALKTPRGNLDYTVNVETDIEGTGGIGEIKITDKQLNGFKIEYTGAAESVSVKCTVQGGYA